MSRVDCCSHFARTSALGAVDLLRNLLADLLAGLRGRGVLPAGPPGAVTRRFWSRIFWTVVCAGLAPLGGLLADRSRNYPNDLRFWGVPPELGFWVGVVVASVAGLFILLFYRCPACGKLQSSSSFSR